MPGEKVLQRSDAVLAGERTERCEQRLWIYQAETVSVVDSALQLRQLELAS